MNITIGVVVIDITAPPASASVNMLWFVCHLVPFVGVSGTASGLGGHQRTVPIVAAGLLGSGMGPWLPHLRRGGGQQLDRLPDLQAVLVPGGPADDRHLRHGLHLRRGLQRLRRLHMDLRGILRRLPLLTQNVHLREGQGKELCPGMGVRPVRHGCAKLHRASYHRLI